MKNNVIEDLSYELCNFFVEKISRKDLERHFVTSLQTILDSGNQLAIQIANQVDADLVEIGEGILDEKGFRERISRYLSDLLRNEVAQENPAHSPPSTHIFIEDYKTSLLAVRG